MAKIERKSLIPWPPSTGRIKRQKPGSSVKAKHLKDRGNQDSLRAIYTTASMFDMLALLES